MIDKDRLQQKAAALGITLGGDQLDQLDRYAEILVQTNRQFNLTAITDPEGIEDKHFIDSLLCAADPHIAGRVADVGSGAGFPGVVLRIYRPGLALTLMEPTGKRLRFLQQLCEALGLKGVEFVKERAEEAARKQWREQFDLVTARAVAAMPALAEYCLPLVRPGGGLLAMKGPDLAGELRTAQHAVQVLGGGAYQAREVELPNGNCRTLIYIPKIGQTPPAYPRNGGKIAKKPL